MSETLTPVAELAALFPKPERFIFGERTIELKPITLDRLAAVGNALQAIAPRLSQLDALTGAAVVDLVLTSPGIARAFLSAVTDEDPNVIGALPLETDDSLRLIERAFARYQDFIWRRLGPLVLAKITALPAAKSPGPTS